MEPKRLHTLLEQAIAARAALFDPAHQTAFRLFNGFSEGEPSLAVDVYGSTLVVQDHADNPAENQHNLREAVELLRSALPWLHAGILKTRNGDPAASLREEGKNGKLLFGERPDTKIKEHSVWYALNLTLNRDAGFYLDTRHLRKWLMENSHGKSVLNTFAYTGSLGVAATAGGTSRVVQTDRNRRFLHLAKDSHSLNGFPVRKKDFIAQDFFPAVAHLKNTRQFFDCVILDPPFFSSTPKGKVDLVNESARLINKVRPLINDGGTLVTINNALYLSGQDYMETLASLCRDGYLRLRELIPVPADFIGNAILAPVTDPAPFNHSTKIAILDVKRK